MSNKQEETIDNLPDALAEIARLEGSMETMRDRVTLGNSTEVEMSLLIMPAHLKAKTIRALECAALIVEVVEDCCRCTDHYSDQTWGLPVLDYDPPEELTDDEYESLSDEEKKTDDELDAGKRNIRKYFLAVAEEVRRS